jgi:hypothetical protein
MAMALRGSGRAVYGDALVIEFALDIAPALYLRQDPHAHRMIRERIEIDAVRNVLDTAHAVGITPGQNLLDHRHRLVEIVLR